MREIIIKLVKTADDDCNDEINKISLSSYNIIAYCFPFLVATSKVKIISGSAISAILHCDDGAAARLQQGVVSELQPQDGGIIEWFTLTPHITNNLNSALYLYCSSDDKFFVSLCTVSQSQYATHQAATTILPGVWWQGMIIVKMIDLVKLFSTPTPLPPSHSSLHFSEVC